MISSVRRLLAKEEIKSEEIRAEIEFLQGAIKKARRDGRIDVHMVLSTGNVISGLRLVAKMLQHYNSKIRYDQQQAREEIEKILLRAIGIEEKFSGFDEIIESYREERRKSWWQLRFK